jgi:hypothetical protein
VVWIEDAANISAGALDRQFARTPYAVNFLSSGQTSSTLLDLSWHISDHFPLWVEFAVPGA